MDAYPCKCKLYKTLSHTKGTNLYKITWNNLKQQNRKQQKNKKYISFYMLFDRIEDKESLGSLTDSQNFNL